MPPDYLLLDSFPNIGPLISRWELDKFINSWNKRFRTSKILTLLYQQFSDLLISQRDMSGPRLEALSNNRWSRGNCQTPLTLISNANHEVLYFVIYALYRDASWIHLFTVCAVIYLYILLYRDNYHHNLVYHTVCWYAPYILIYSFIAWHIF
jgi:hypothetical protein